MPVNFTSSWMGISGEAPLRYTVSGSDVAHVMVGDGTMTCELELDANAMHSLARVACAAAAEMDALYAREEAEQETAEHDVPGRHHLVEAS